MNSLLESDLVHDQLGVTFWHEPSDICELVKLNLDKKSDTRSDTRSASVEREGENDGQWARGKGSLGDENVGDDERYFDNISQSLD